ncbi:hypothetical protein SAMN04487897_13116 [Paenibacillus sp. yr247]|uniref:hypothetical protein n=1 Tax=Paenibacillus sp. yr247 TaxID=1761880 RepID=UPI000891C18E|nr:hypothetical protein [Paenibacillus sp. yr247]SDP02043.1 hypothetical protein SAMN04487897_13116 [Paenibacillus sp. yr247]
MLKKRNGIVSFLLVIVLAFSFFTTINVAFHPAPAYADSLNDAKLGTTTGDTGIKDITSELKKWILNLRIVGAVLAVFGIVIGAIIFSLAIGNAQKRSVGTGAIISAIVGIIIIAKAPTLADYFITQAQATTP